MIKTRLQSFPTLLKVLGPNWLSTQLSKKPHEWSLITDWLATLKADAAYATADAWLVSVEGSLVLLKQHVTKPTWLQLSKKISEHANREKTKGTLSEVALALFLVENSLIFEMEKKLVTESHKDVDFSIDDPTRCLLNIEVTWLGEAGSHKRAAEAADGAAFQVDVKKVESRIQKRLLAKAEKFTTDDITLVALNLTDDPGNSATVASAFTQALKGGDSAAFAPIDGVIWFELESAAHLLLKQRHIVLRADSAKAQTIQHSKFHQAWISL